MARLLARVEALTEEVQTLRRERAPVQEVRPVVGSHEEVQEVVQTPVSRAVRTDDDVVANRFRKENPIRFGGGVEPEEAQRWIRHIEHVFSFVRPRDEDRVRLATRQLQGEALEWWQAVEDDVDRDVQGLSWEDFLELFYEEFFPESVKWQKRGEFAQLQQGNRTVVEYEREFRKLSRFAPEAVSTEDLKAHKFVHGLRADLRERVEPLRLDTYHDVVETARIVERNSGGGRQPPQSRAAVSMPDRDGGSKRPRWESRDRGASSLGLSRLP